MVAQTGQKTITIHLRLYGILRDRLPAQDRGRANLPLPAGATVQDVLEHYNIGAHATFALNDEIELAADQPLQDGDRLEIFRPSAGG